MPFADLERGASVVDSVINSSFKNHFVSASRTRRITVITRTG